MNKLIAFLCVLVGIAIIASASNIIHYLMGPGFIFFGVWQLWNQYVD